MRDARNSLDRRSFLKLGASGVAAASSAGFLPELLAEPAGAVVLRSAAMELRLDGATGLPMEYRLVRSGVRFTGDVSGVPLQARLCRREPWEFAGVAVRPSGHRVSGGRADFHFTAMFAAEAAAAEFVLRYALEGRTVRVTLEEVQERAGFELISLGMPSLVSVEEHDSDAWLAHGNAGGDMVALSEAKAGKLGVNSFWGEINGVLPVVMAGHSGAVCVQETTAFMDGTLLSVEGGAPKRRACLGTTKVHRVDGGACYNMNLGRGMPLSCGNRATPNLIVEQTSACRLDFLEPAAGGRALNWMDGAKLVRARMPGIPN
ncbi:MAG: hypothetical protein V4555_11570, partial [Acidobacteriota bacterium]